MSQTARQRTILTIAKIIQQDTFAQHVATDDKHISTLSLNLTDTPSNAIATMLAVSNPLNISCTCTECSTFLQPMPKSPSSSSRDRRKYLLPKSNKATSDKKKSKNNARKYKIARTSSANLWSPLIVSTTTLPMPYPFGSSTSPFESLASIWTTKANTITNSTSPSIAKAKAISISTQPKSNRTPTTPFSKTPGALKCTHTRCQKRVPITYGLGKCGGVLCEAHEGALKDSVK
ncbi:hypothetical protein EK21DRAFT_84832 [Setomelanomma holmii]|uniref:Uncharacterized protein n=1 Tax=Setomelanomma holmii TaxID=210430 RepID=A0A9P4HLL5_9PLEO|nr:hypothetical protein EK21DRAFT_84832 [Setomelanomma holmii]